MGDDATHLLVLDTSLNIIDSIPILSFQGNRIPKETKPDLEASAFNSDSNEIFIFVSGSLSPYRNLAWRYNIQTRVKDSVSLENLYSQVKNLGIEQVNIEGACFIAGKLILVNRGNKDYPKNHLIITDDKFWHKDSSFQISIIPFAAQRHSTSFN